MSTYPFIDVYFYHLSKMSSNFSAVYTYFPLANNKLSVGKHVKTIYSTPQIFPLDLNAFVILT